MKRKLGGWSVYSCWILAWGLVYISPVGLRAEDAWLWAKDIGGMWGTQVGVDGVGNAYVLGQFSVQETIEGVDLQPNTNYENSYLMKYNPAGTLRWGRQVGAGLRAIHVDPAGTIYLGGYVEGNARFGTVDFQSKTNATGKARRLIFAARYDTRGEILWARKIGDADHADVDRVAVDDTGNYFVAGSFRGDASFLGSSGAEKTDAGSSALFVRKYSGNGALLWDRTEVGSTNSTLSVDDMIVSNVGECFIMGNVGWGEQNISIGGTKLGSLTPATKFVGKLNGNGEFEWVKEIKVALGAFFPYSSLSLDEAANVYVVGGFVRHAQIADKSVVSTNVSDFYMAKFDRIGNLDWVRAGGDCCSNDVRSSAIDKNGNIYLTGTFSFTSSLSTNRPIKRIPIVRKYSQNGELLAEEYGHMPASGNDIAINSAGNIVVTGGLGLEGSVGQVQLSAGGEDRLSGYIARLRPFVRSGIAKIELIGSTEVLVSMQGFTEGNYRIETSLDMVQWTPFISLPGGNGTIEFSDFPSANPPAKFYRIITVP